MVCGLASFICPGLGQALAGKGFDGLGWFFGTILGYVLFIVPGIVIHYFCIKNAVELGEERERRLAIITAVEIDRLRRDAANSKSSFNAQRTVDLWKQR